MVKTIRKMQRVQNKIKKYFEENGYLVWIIHHSKFSKDIWGMFDGIAIKDGVVYFLQIKSNRFPVIKKYRNFADKYGINIILARWVDYKGVELKFIHKEK